jgi:hypothetical protein
MTAIFTSMALKEFSVHDLFWRSEIVFVLRNRCKGEIYLKHTIFTQKYTNMKFIIKTTKLM